MAGNSRYRGTRRDRPRPSHAHSRDMTPMLNVGRLSTFRYDFKEIMRRHRIEGPAASSLMATVVAKASRISIESAKAYLREQEELGACSRAASDEMCDLLARFSKVR